MRIAIVLITGFTQPSHRAGGAGLWRLYDLLADRHYDRRQTWMTIRPWDSDELVHDAVEIVRFAAQRVVVIAYSWGAGRGLPAFAAALARHNAVISLACLIDPVVHTTPLRPLTLALSALTPSPKPFAVPANVRRASLWRTVNWSGITTPWGRDIEAQSADAVIWRRVFGSETNLMRHRPRADVVTIDDDVVHGNIDDHTDVHLGVLDQIAQIL